MGNPFKRQGTSNTARGRAVARGRVAGHGLAAARGRATGHGPAAAHGRSTARGRVVARGRAVARGPVAAHGPAVARRGSWKAALNKALSVTLSFVLIVTMSPISSVEALAVEKYDEANQAGGGFKRIGRRRRHGFNQRKRRRAIS